MHLVHVVIQVLLSAEHDEFLVKATTLFAREVFLREMSFLRTGLVDRLSGSVEGTDQCFKILEAESNQPLPRVS